MADVSFDVVVLGGGHQGLIVACYMATNGYTVGLFEQRRELGGGGATESRPLPGFRGNPCAHVAGFWGCPANQDFRLHEKGLKYIFPEVQTSMVFPDGRCMVSYRSVDYDVETGIMMPKMDMIEKNLVEMARISKEDAATMEMMAPEQVWKWGLAASQALWNPPPLPGEYDPIKELLEDPTSGIDRRYECMTVTEIVKDVFKSPELQAHSLRMVGSAGIWPDDVAPLPTVISTVPQQLFGLGGCVYAGGTHNVIHALQRALSENGGHFFVGADVDRIVVENGKAKGIKLADGTEVEAKQLVISSVEIKQTVARHFRDTNIISDSVRRKIENLRTDRGNIFWGHIAFHELPRYNAAAWNPDCGKARWVFFGDTDVDYMYREYRFRNQGIRPGRWPEKMYLWEGTDSQWDPSYAPPGKHVALLEEMGPPASWLTEQEWLEVRKELPDKIIKEWQKYAPNMNWENVIATNIDTPYDCQNRSDNFPDGAWNSLAAIPSQWCHMRPIPEFSQYRIPGLDNFWMASGSQHHSLGLTGFAGYNCYKRLAQTFNLWKPWEGRLY